MPRPPYPVPLLKESLRHHVNTPGNTRPLFSTARFKARRSEVLLHMSHFFLRYLGHLYRAFDGDLAMAIILGEISHHNTAKFFSPENLTNDAIRNLQDQPSKWDQMDGCNAFSLSSATGIPRETVRRKVADLKKRGWIEDVPRKGLRITSACAYHFGPDFSMTILAELLKASRAIEHVLGTGAGLPASEPLPRKQTSSRKQAKKSARNSRPLSRQ